MFNSMFLFLIRSLTFVNNTFISSTYCVSFDCVSFLQPFPTIHLHVELFRQGFLFNLLHDNNIDNFIMIYNRISKILK